MERRSAVYACMYETAGLGEGVLIYSEVQMKEVKEVREMR